MGKPVIQQGTIYPSPGHPSGYYFTWEKGRTLHEFQVVYITEGKGVYEDFSGEYQIKPGSLLVIKPGIKHRYKPDASIGWTENYVGFNGPTAKTMFRNPTPAFNSWIFPRLYKRGNSALNRKYYSDFKYL